MTFFLRDPDSRDSQDTQVLYLKFVHNTDKAITWCKSKGINWDYANVYDRRTRDFKERVYNPFSSNIELQHEKKQLIRTWKMR